MACVLLQERFAFTGGKVKRPGVDGYTGAYPIVEGVLLCGSISANKRRYKPEAFAGDRVKRYNDRPVFFNHGKRNETRGYEEKGGSIENARHRADGMPIGDLAVNPEHPLAKAFLFDAEHKPGSCGMSHVAHCETVRSADGWDEVTEMVEAESVDVVVGPATTKGLFESKGGAAVKITIKTLAERIVKHPKSTTEQCTRMKALAEGEYGLREVEEPAADAEPASEIDKAFESLMSAHLSEMIAGSTTVDDFCKKIKALAKAHKGKEEPKDEPAEPPKEGKQPADYPTILRECAAQGYVATADELEMLALQPDAAKRKAFIEGQRAKVKAEEVKSGGRRPGAGSPPAGSTTTVTEERAIPKW